MKKTPEQLHMEKVAALGCIVPCCKRPAQVHHIGNMTTSKKSSDFETIPLCVDHHLGSKCSIHRTPYNFVEKYGTEEDLLRKVQFMLKRKINNFDKK